jgi:hypothetical protein
VDLGVNKNMNACETFKVSGEVDIKIFSSTGEVVKEFHHKNMVVNRGKSLIASRLASNQINPICYMSIGNNDSITSATQTTLEGELVRVPISPGAVQDNKVMYVGLFDSDTIGAQLIKEAGLFNASSNTTNSYMLCRTVFPGIMKNADESIAITWTLTIN